MKLNPTTPVIFYARESAYTEGQGATSEWRAVVGTPLYCEWKGSYGDRALTAQAMGVNDSAVVRMFYHPTVYEKLRTKRVAIIKNAVSVKAEEPDKDDPDTYELWGGVDNVAEENRYMEFKVRRYEGK